MRDTVKGGKKMNDLEIISKFNLLYEKKVVLFGAGNYGVKLYKELNNAGMNLVAFADSNPLKWGSEIQGLTVLSFEQLKNLTEQEEIILIISVDLNLGKKNTDEIINIIQKLGIKTYKMVSSWGARMALFANSESNYIQKPFQEIYSQYKYAYIKRLINDREMYMQNALYQASTALLEDDPILIYQSCKVASTTVREMLTASSLHPVHMHVMDVIEDQNKYNIELLKKTDKKVKIITLVRDPISRDLSLLNNRFHRLSGLEACFLENLDKVFADVYQFYKDYFIKRTYDNEIKIDNPWKVRNEFEWFDVEFKAVTGVDVYEYPFDVEKGYGIIEKDNLQIMIVTVEQMANLLDEIAKFVGVEHLELTRSNEGDSKVTYYAYQELRKNIRFDEADFAHYYHHAKINHFYSSEQQDEFMKKWKRKNEKGR